MRGRKIFESSPAPGFKGTSVAIGDFNGDGANDIVAGGTYLDQNSYGLSQVTVLFGTAHRVSTISKVDLTNAQSARSTMTSLSAQLERLLGEFGIIGSSQSRLSTALNVATSANVNYLAAASRIADDDIGLKHRN